MGSAAEEPGGEVQRLKDEVADDQEEKGCEHRQQQRARQERTVHALLTPGTCVHPHHPSCTKPTPQSDGGIAW